ncbi:aminopeptidase P family protein, partial [bacterium]|nr:aminopeptidase P family protein [bacterium]
MSSEYVARRAVSLAKRPRRTLVIPWWFRPLVSFDYHFPSLVDWLLKVAFVRRFHKVETAPREAPCGHAVGQAPFRGCFARSPTKRRNMRISRLTKLSESLRASNLDALALNPSPSLTYLTSLHFHISERPVVVIFTADHAPVIILPELEMLKVTGLPYEIKAFPYPENPAEWEGVFRRAVQSLGLDGRRIGVEPRAMRLLEFRHIQAGAPEADFPDASDAVSRLRVRKDPDEIAAMRKAVKAAQSALEATIPFIKIGMTEKEIAGELVVQLLRHGSQSEMPFAPIVSGGPNSANPHASPSERRLQPGDLLVVDWGASVDGYISDLTRTFAIGEVEAEYRKIHQIVLEANAAGRAAAKPGVPCANVDKAAREVIEKAGYGQYFTHRTGHGIGMEGHEEPYM